MDNKKIGKLIAKLRNEKKLTQQELGDKVGVGFRAVSKWERGLTLPDISIINDLSKILGISSDELLSGELKKKDDKKKISSINKTAILVTVVISIITLIVSSIISFSKNKTYIYDMHCVDGDKYYVEGQVSFTGNDISIIINELGFFDEKISSKIIQDYDYKIISQDVVLFGYGYNSNGRYIDEEQTIKEFAQAYRVNYDGTTELTKEEILNNNIVLVINFIGKDNRRFTTEIEILLTDQK